MSICEAIILEMSRVLTPYRSFKKTTNIMKQVLHTPLTFNAIHSTHPIQANAFLVRLEVLNIFFSEFVQIKLVFSFFIFMK